MYAIEIPDEIKARLLPYQVQHVSNLVGIIRNHNRAGDFSEMGTGKTPSSIAASLILKRKPFVCTPLAVVPTWFYWLKEFKAECYGVANYEKLHNQRCYLTRDEVVDCPYVEHRELAEKTSNQYASKRRKDGSVSSFKWKLPEDAILIFDEVHKCKNPRTMNAILLFAAANTNIPILILSGTVCDTPEGFQLPGYVLGLYPNVRHAKSWIAEKSIGFRNDPMLGVHKSLYPERAQRLKVKDLSGYFPENTILCEPYDMETAKEIEEQYQIIGQEIERLQNREDSSGSVLAKILYARMRIEQLKVPHIIEMARQLVEEGSSVPIFVNFTNTLKCLSDELKTKCAIYGEQSPAEREENIRAFQADEERIIVCNIKSGGVGLSLHDLNGNHPRAVIISPTFSALDLAQVLKRAHRAGCKTPVRQWLLLCAGTIEERVGERLREKLINIDLINDGDLGALHIPGLHEQERAEPPSDSEVDQVRLTVLMLKRSRLLKKLKETQEEIDKINKK